MGLDKKCYVAVSGGVDSAVALTLIKQNGYSAEGVTMTVFDSELVPTYNERELDDAKALCERLGVPHHTIDLKKEFYNKVITDFISSYGRGETPNPCIVCNRFLKFGALADYCFKNGADVYATGHYVRVLTSGDRKIIARAKDEKKDQSYMLWSLTPDQISRFYAPLGEFSKDEVRAIDLNLGLAVATKGDSQDICFIPDGDYRAFLNRTAGDTDFIGDFVHTNGKILGKHLGQRSYTIGQRKGLGIAYTEPLYVVGRDMAKNQIILGSNDDLFVSEFRVRSANFSAIDYPTGDFRCEVKIRYHAPAVDCILHPIEDGIILVKTATPVRAVTPGQSAVFYSDDILLGGGVIC